MKNRKLTPIRALALPAVLGHYFEKHSRTFCLRLLIPVFLLAWMSPVQGDTIEDFVIQNSSNPSVPGGTFFEGGTYSGSFSLDTSQIPSNSSSIPLLTFDIVINVAPFINADLSPANGSVANWRTFPVANNSTLPFPLQGDLITFDGPGVGVGGFELWLLEPPGTFHGGLVYLAQVQDITGFDYFDISGSAIVIDPALVPAPTPTPEPNCGLLLAGGVCLFAGIRRKRWPKLSTTAGESRD